MTHTQLFSCENIKRIHKDTNDFMTLMMDCGLPHKRMRFNGVLITKTGAHATVDLHFEGIKKDIQKLCEKKIVEWDAWMENPVPKYKPSV